ncbi:glycoside hydrolase family 47 protein [Peniophora sp. CONT]|nr:glycoside hydrolase family 47 protein [Peniophora sp. CONT]
MAPRSRTLTLAALALAPAGALAGAVQAANLTLPSSAAANKQAVVDIFTSSYNAYKQYAYGHDEVAPISKGFLDPRNGWGASIIDGMTTMYIMNLTDLFNDAVAFAEKIDFSVNAAPEDDVSVFESTIRYVAGLISAYELSGKQNSKLIEKAEQLTSRMVDIAFANNVTVPYGHLNFTTNSGIQSTSNIAEVGTLTLEYDRLSLYTGNNTYRQLAEKAAKYVANYPTPPLPGLPAQCIEPGTGSFACDYVTWGGGSDSYFEYLIKYARMTNNADETWVNAWKLAVDSSIQTLKKKSTVGNYTYIADYDGNRIVYVSSHLECFHAGNWLLGGKLLNNDTIVEIALEMNEACWNTYNSTLTGIGPETFAFVGTDGNYTGNSITADQLNFYEQHGFYITDADYIERPEVLESNFYAYRVTGDQKYLDRAASAVASFNKYLKLDNGGYTDISDVTNANSSRYDETESFWFAEVLKYLYLTFDDPSHISLDEYVFNTEAHPFIAPAPLTQY